MLSPLAEHDCTPRPLVRIIGAPSSGKSTLAVALGEALDLPVFDIHTERIRFIRPGHHWPVDKRAPWRALGVRIEQSRSGCIVETAGTAREEAALYHGRRYLTIYVHAPRHIRRQRLTERATRGDDPTIRDARDYIERLTSYEQDPPPDEHLDWDGATPCAGPTFDALVESCRAHWSKVAA
jgi:hypothetical protein